MSVTGYVWMALTDSERLARIESAVKQNAKRWRR